MNARKYLPVSEAEVKEQLQRLGLKNLDELFRSLPADFLTEPSSSLGPPMSEIEIRKYLSSREPVPLCFLGGNGHYHYIPSIIDPLVSRGEFLTAYTPYQPEISQGTLQAMFEYQSMMAGLMGVEVSNASLYDGSTATVEAGMMACRIARKYKLVVSAALHPEYLDTIKTYSENGPFSMVTVPVDVKGRTDAAAIRSAIDGDTAAVIVQSPNGFGVIEDLDAIRSLCNDQKTMMVVTVTEALSLALLKTPGACGADIVCGEAQSFGIPLSLGGPWLGFIGTSMHHVRNLPGRLIGQTKDTEGRRAFVVTLAAREQHIRREKATSNICTNQGLMALRAAIYLCVMGRAGLRAAAERSAKLAHHARRLLLQQSNVIVEFPDSPVFNEILIRTPVEAAKVFERCMASSGIAPGTILDEHRMLCAFDETKSLEDIARWVSTVTAASK
jgi:glycine dehydrogenase subunit 1